MRSSRGTTCGALCLMLVALAGCSRSNGAPDDWGQKRAVGAAHAWVAFTPVAPATLANAAVVYQCNIDHINLQTAAEMAVDHLAIVDFSGWAADTRMQSVPPTPGVLLARTDKWGEHMYWAFGHSGGVREDVAASMRNQVYRLAGFHVVASLSNVPIGDYQAAVVYKDGEGRWSRCGTTVPVSVQ